MTREEYPYLQRVPTRWADNDVYGHVNNTHYYAVFDTVINTWLIREGGLDIRSGEVIGVCAESQCRFLASVEFPLAIDAGLRVGHLGRSSVRYELALFGEDVPAPGATGYFVHVFVERRSRRPTEMPPRIRVALQRLCLTPPQADNGRRGHP